jgi:hypothetical protein
MAHIRTDRLNSQVADQLYNCMAFQLAIGHLMQVKNGLQVDARDQEILHARTLLVDVTNRQAQQKAQGKHIFYNGTETSLVATPACRAFL